MSINIYKIFSLTIPVVYIWGGLKTVNVSLSYAYFFMFLLFLIVVIGREIRQGKVALPQPLIAWIIILLMICSYAFTIDLQTLAIGQFYLFYAIFFLGVFVPVLVGISYLRDPSIEILIANIFIFVGVVFSISKGLDPSGVGTNGAFGAEGAYQWVSRIAWLGFVSSAYMLILHKGKAKSIYTIALIICLCGMILGGARQVIIPFIFLMAYLLYTNKKTTIFLLCAVTIVALNFYDVLAQIRGVERIVDIIRTLWLVGAVEVLVMADRWFIFVDAFQRFSESPFWGIGLDNYRSSYGIESYTHPHNVVFELLLSFGLVGTSLMFSFILVLFARFDYQTVTCPLLFWIGVSYLFMGMFSGDLKSNWPYISSVTLAALSTARKT